MSNLILPKVDDVQKAIWKLSNCCTYCGCDLNLPYSEHHALCPTYLLFLSTLLGDKHYSYKHKMKEFHTKPTFYDIHNDPNYKIKTKTQQTIGKTK
jgi:hypothetical protein